MVPTRREQSPNGVSTDDLCDVLANPDRRVVLHLLDRREGDVDVTALAREVAAFRARERTDPDGGGGYERVRLELRHCHGPKMDDAGLVDYDPAASTIELTATLPPIGALGSA